jgi:hypothetical protein
MLLIRVETLALMREILAVVLGLVGTGLGDDRHLLGAAGGHHNVVTLFVGMRRAAGGAHDVVTLFVGMLRTAGGAHDVSPLFGISRGPPGV